MRQQNSTRGCFLSSFEDSGKNSFKATGTRPFFHILLENIEVFFHCRLSVTFSGVRQYHRRLPSYDSFSPPSYSYGSSLGSKGNMDIYDSSIFPRARTGGEINLLPGLERWKKESSLKAPPLIAKEMQRKSGRNATSREEEDPFPTVFLEERRKPTPTNREPLTSFTTHTSQLPLILNHCRLFFALSFFTTSAHCDSFNLGLTRLAFYDIGLKAYSQARFRVFSPPNGVRKDTADKRGYLFHGYRLCQERHLKAPYSALRATKGLVSYGREALNKGFGSLPCRSRKRASIRSSEPTVSTVADQDKTE
ncbi:myb domain protein 15 [Striga asiatica]|uniref:Myb domain protein 15 n=1 Tax=Striga asiatica TaxID=4170 RepID=A0A5A7Q1I0_STRAF|nr:myb domain protein 15 [Striga asiatica]